VPGLSMDHQASQPHTGVARHTWRRRHGAGRVLQLFPCAPDALRCNHASPRATPIRNPSEWPWPAHD
jgi:hypothetical protein